MALGGNLGAVLRTFDEALFRMATFATPLAVSAAYRTEAMVLAGQQAPPFWNAVVVVQTQLSPLVLLGRLQQLERQAGRAAAARWAPRPLDLDILLLEQTVIDTPVLRVPHPGLLMRPFVLQPLCDVRPAAVVPPENLEVASHLARLAAPAAGILDRRQHWRRGAHVV